MKGCVIKMRYTKEEQMRFIIQCRQCGLSDHQWCRDNDIKPSTLYTWIKRLREAGNIIPEKTTAPVPIKQEVVKINPKHGEDIFDDGRLKIEHNAPISTFSNNLAAEITGNGISIKLYNTASAGIIKSVLLALK